MTKLLLFSILFIAAVARAELIMPGELSEAPLLMGQGYHSVKGSTVGNCVTLGAFETQSGNETGQLAEFQLLEITSEYSLQKSLNIETAISLRTGLFGGGKGVLNFAESVNKHSQSKYLLVHTRVSNQLQIAKSFTFNPETQKLLRQGDADTDKFAKHCGTHFVFARRTGGEFYALFEFEMHSEQENRAFSMAVGASGLGWKGAAKINETLQQFNQFSIVQVKQYRMGGNGELPDVENLNQYARSFPTNVVLVSSSPVTLELILKDYSGVTPFENWGDLADLFVDQRLILQDLAKDISFIKEFQNTIREVKSHPNQYNYDEIGSALDQDTPILIDALNSLYQAARQCLFKSPEDCHYPVGIFLPSYPNIIKKENNFKMVTAFSNQQCKQINMKHDYICSLMTAKARYPIFSGEELKGYCDCL
jgi:hypothetical protein